MAAKGKIENPHRPELAAEIDDGGVLLVDVRKRAQRPTPGAITSLIAVRSSATC
jgi:hypothetical protein